MIRRKKDPEGSLFTGMHFSDWGIILIAAMMSAVAAYLLLTPEDYGAKFAKAAKVLTAPGAEPAQPPTSGESRVMIFKDRPPAPGSDCPKVAGKDAPCM